MVWKGLYRLDRILTFFEEWTLFIAVMAALLGLFVSVCLRYCFSHCLPWPEELVRETIQYTTFVGAAAAVKTGATLKIDVLPSFFPRLKAHLGYFSDFALLCFSVYITVFGWKAAMSIRGQSTVILEIPYVWLYMMLPLMGVIMGLRTVMSLLTSLAAKKHEAAVED